jgi:peptidyl-prolyl cis-trans isomerase C
MTRLSAACVVFAALTTAGCVREPPAEQPYPVPSLISTGTEVARIGPVRITSDELERRMSGQSPAMMERLSEPDRKKDFLEQQVRFELLAQEGWARGMHKDPEVISELKKAIVQRLLKEELEKRTKEDNVSEAELHAAYAKAQEEFHKPETIRLSQIVRKAEDDRDRTKERALLESVKRDVTSAEKQNKPGAFEEAVKQHSEDDATKNGGGELPFMSRAEMETKYGPVVAKSIFEEAKIGDMVIAEREGELLLLKKTGQRRAVDRTLEMVKPQLRARILRDKRNAAFDAFIAELEKKHGAKVDLSALERVSGSPDGGLSP